MKTKSLTGLALLTTLAACGGGGGGGGGTGFTPIQVSDLGSINTAAISNGFASAIQKIAGDGLVDAKDTLEIFKWVDANENINTTELAKYNVTVNGTKMSLQKAWFMLKGYKKLYYDGKETFWQNLVDNKQYDDTDSTFIEIKAIALKDDPNYAEAIGKGGKTVDQFKKDKDVKTLVSTATNTITTDSDPVVGEPTVTTTYVDATADTLLDDGRTKRETTRTYTHTSKTPSTVTTTTYTQYTYTYSDGTTNVANGPKTTTNNTTYTTTISTEAKIISTTYIAPAKEDPVEEEKDDKPIEEEKPVEEKEEEKPVEEEKEEKPVEEEKEEKPVEEEKDDTPTIVDVTTFKENKVWSHVDKTFGPETTTTEDIVSYSGSQKITTRRATTCKIEYHEHFDKVDTITRTTYSDNTTKDVVDSTEYFTRGKVNKGESCNETDTVISIVETDNGEIGDDHKDMGTKTPGYNSNASFYETDEYNYISNKQLDVSNFSTAYSRGWTGKDSLITIADTGANTSHVDLDDNIKYTKDFTGNGISNSSSHGTHVAGIAGAEKNGTGMHGAAFDADLAIAKVGNGLQFSFSHAKSAAAWGRDKGSVAINLSAELNLDSGFRKSLVKVGDGNYYSTHWYYGVNGYNGSVNEASSWKSALGNEQVLVKAAGNAGRDYSAGMNQMATATDANGNLILDGQMIIVGNYDTNNGIINSSSNKAGTVCATYQNNVCIDAKKIKDFYIMADGTGVTSTAENGGYVTMSGTSMAAPVVTGSIAVLHQMWPHMKGKHLVQLVLVTGNKNIAGYDENVHGQGLLDMDKATRPVGATGIPTTGRTNGGVSSISGGANISGVSAGQMQALTGVMVLDSFERDFYIDLGDMTQDVDTRTASVAKQMGAVNYFAPYMNSEQHALFPTYNVSENSNIQIGFGNSNGHYLGNSFNGTLGTTKDSTTLYANYNYRDGGFYAQAGLGYSTVNFDTSNSLLTTETANVISSTATVGYEVNPADGHKLGFAVSQPVTVEDAKLSYNVPTSRTLDGKVNYENKDVNFKSNKREIDVGTYYSFNIGKTGNAEIDDFTKRLGLTGSVNTFAEIRTGVSALKKEIEKAVGLNVQLKF